MRPWSPDGEDLSSRRISGFDVVRCGRREEDRVIGFPNKRSGDITSKNHRNSFSSRLSVFAEGARAQLPWIVHMLCRVFLFFETEPYVVRRRVTVY